MTFDVYFPFRNKAGKLCPGVKPIPKDWSEIYQICDSLQHQKLIEDYRAACKLIYNYTRRFVPTVEGIIKKWAPASENNTENYIKIVCKRSGLSRGTIIDIEKTATFLRFVDAMAFVENGYTPSYLSLVKGYLRAGTQRA